MNLCKISPARPVLRMKKSSQTARLSSAMRDAPVYRTLIASSSAEDAFFHALFRPGNYGDGNAVLGNGLR